MMTILLQLLGFIAKQGLTFGKFVAGLSRVALLQVALKAKQALVYISAFVTARTVFLASIVLLFEAGLAGLSFLVITPLSSSLLSALLPTNDPYAQGLYHLLWDEGFCLSTLWGYVVMYFGNVLAVHGVIDVFARAISYRIMVYDGRRSVSLGLLSGR